MFFDYVWLVNVFCRYMLASGYDWYYVFSTHISSHCSSVTMFVMHFVCYLNLDWSPWPTWSYWVSFEQVPCTVQSAFTLLETWSSLVQVFSYLRECQLTWLCFALVLHSWFTLSLCSVLSDILMNYMQYVGILMADQDIPYSCFMYCLSVIDWDTDCCSELVVVVQGHGIHSIHFFNNSSSMYQNIKGTKVG